jgi:hypothetical protein
LNPVSPDDISTRLFFPNTIAPASFTCATATASRVGLKSADGQRRHSPGRRFTASRGAVPQL